MTNAFVVFIMRQYAFDLPDALIEAGRVTRGAAMASSTDAMLPIAAQFVFFQPYFVKDLTAAAVKGDVVTFDA